MKVENIIVSDISANQITVEIQVSDLPELEESAQYVVASVKLPNPDQARTMGKLQLDAIHAARELLEQAAVEIEQELTR